MPSVFKKKISGKVAPLALAIGARLEEFESSQQSLDLYCDVLKMWRTDTKVNASLETLGAWFEPSLSTKALEYTVKLKTRMGKCLCDMGEMEKGALGYRDAYLVSLRTQQFIMLVCYDYVFAPHRYIIPVYVSCFCKKKLLTLFFVTQNPFMFYPNYVKAHDEAPCIAHCFADFALPHHFWALAIYPVG